VHQTTSERALILAPQGRDAALAAAMLDEGGIAGDCCRDTAELARMVGEGVGFVVVTEESLAGANIQPLIDRLEAQEPWSDIPFILLTRRGGGLERNPQARRDLTNLRNVTFLERPFHPTSLISLATAALRARRRQYETRSLIAEISERERDLRDSERQFRTLADTMPALCFIADAGGAVSWYNQRWYDFTGARGNRVLGSGWQTVHDPEILPEVIARWAKSTTTGQPFEMVFPLRAATGEFRYHLTRAVPMRGDDGRVAGWIGTQTDITDQRSAELALRNLADELETRVEERTRLHTETVAQLHEAQKIETLGQLTGGVAHDFNNLLTPVMGALDMLGRIHVDARSQRLIRGAQEASERSRTLISRLLAFARRQVLAATAVDVSKLVEGMADLIQRSLGPQIAMSLELDHATPPAWVDANQLELALLNLAVNARDAMPDGGELTISVKLGPGNQDPDDTDQDGCVYLAVADTGMGMDAQTLARAIEPFFSTKSVGKGTGLGLSMVHGLAAQSGGKLILHSKSDHGTCATLTLPVAVSASLQEADQSQPVNEIMHPMKVLLVDDHELARDSTAEMLAEMGHAVTQCCSGEEALEMMHGGRFQFIVSDYLMGGMTGSQLMEKVHEQTPNLPFALISGFAPGDETDRAVKLLAKPFTRAELARAMLDSIRASGTGDQCLA
jgi:PAS domain S-box-containing protein